MLQNAKPMLLTWTLLALGLTLLTTPANAACLCGSISYPCAITDTCDPGNLFGTPKPKCDWKCTSTSCPDLVNTCPGVDPLANCDRNNDGYCVICGTTGADTIFGTEIDDLICGRGGNDTIDAREGNNRVDGAGGNDYIVAGGGDDFIDGGAGNDTIDAGHGNNVVLGNADDDVITTGAGNDSIDGGNGNDTINAGDGDNTIAGGDGDDSITDGIGASTIDGGAGSDCIYGGGGEDFIEGGSGNDLLVSGGGILSPYSGNLQPFGSRLCGGAGNDVLWANSDGGTCIDGGSDQAAVGQSFHCLPTIPFSADCFGASQFNPFLDDIAMRNCDSFADVHGQGYSLVPLPCGCSK